MPILYRESAWFDNQTEIEQTILVAFENSPEISSIWTANDPTKVSAVAWRSHLNDISSLYSVEDTSSYLLPILLSGRDVNPEIQGVFGMGGLANIHRRPKRASHNQSLRRAERELEDNDLSCLQKWDFSLTGRRKSFMSR